MSLEPKQQRFVEEYLKDLNATQAAIRAGYAKASARVQASRLLAQDKVQDAVAELMAARSDRTAITADMVLTELGKIGFANMLDFIRVQDGGDAYVDLSTMTREQAAALSEVTVDEYTEGRGEDAREVKRVKVKLADKRAALVDIGRHLGMFKDKVELSGKDGAPVGIEVIRRVIVDPGNTDA